MKSFFSIFVSLARSTHAARKATILFWFKRIVFFYRFQMVQCTQSNWLCACGWVCTRALETASQRQRRSISKTHQIYFFSAIKDLRNPVQSGTVMKARCGHAINFVLTRFLRFSWILRCLYKFKTIFIVECRRFSCYCCSGGSRLPLTWL